MLELYSTNVTEAQNGSIPFNNTSIAKGVTAIHNGPSTIELNKSGIYMVSVHGSITPAAAGTVSIQLARNDALQLDAVSSATGAADETTHLGFDTLVQVKSNNTCCCDSSPTTLQVINTGQAGVFPIVNIVVTKVC